MTFSFDDLLRRASAYDGRSLTPAEFFHLAEEAVIQQDEYDDQFFAAGDDTHVSITDDDLLRWGLTYGELCFVISEVPSVAA